MIKRLAPLLGVFLFGFALFLLHRELRDYHYRDVIRQFGWLSRRQVFEALLLTLVNYLVLTGYEKLGFEYISRPLKFRKVAVTSFIANAFSNNVSLAMLAGSSVRYRLYSGWGLSATEITKIILFYTLTFWIGLFALGGTVFLLEPVNIPRLLHVPFHSAHPIGWIFIFLILGYLAWVISRKGLQFREWELSPPSLKIALLEIVISSLDWALAAGVLYVLLPEQSTASFPVFLCVFLLAQVAGLVSQVPGGFGIFETVTVVLLSSTAPTPSLLASVLAYRGIYYLLPLGLASTLLGTHEVLERSPSIKRFASLFGQWVPTLVPYVFTFTTFVGGCILLFSGATPAVGSRLAWINDFLPLPVLEASHFLSSLAGVGLIFLASGLQRRLDAAYFFSVSLLGAGILFSLLKGFDYEEAIALTVMFTALLPARRHFYRRASLLNEPFSPGWVLAILVVLSCTLWLGVFSYKHIEYSHDLWWRFTLSGDAPRFLRAFVGVVGVALFFAWAKLMQPAQTEPALPIESDLEKAKSIIQESRETYAHLALLGDKSLLFNGAGNAFIMYAVQGKSRIALGDPVGPAEEAAELIWQFREMGDRHDARTVFYDVRQDYLHHYLDVGLTMVRSGEEARVSLPDFSIEGGTHKKLRYFRNRLEKEGCAFEVIPAREVGSLLPFLRRISDTWLEQKKTKEKKFSMGFFDPRYLLHFPIGVVRKGGETIAFANLWPGAQKEELSIDLMRYLPEAPPNVMEYLFVELMLWGKQEGYRWFNLGVVPLSGLENRAFAPFWNRIGAFVFRYAENFYNFQGLREFKDKFDPVWEPKYLIFPGGFSLAGVLTDLAVLVSGGVKGVFSK